ncbi:hypothetical protein B0T14DRAFT_240041 [Immersiella caudata]|uniref:Uncharacterized protein n=1 Tax=Immersiella caudata TaxID=314043 RepID=A0AA39WSU6_9PEZI|nr:hypothetical protein B0T14DRAFT_240041 [Immersiella caudata]
MGRLPTASPYLELLLEACQPTSDVASVHPLGFCFAARDEGRRERSEGRARKKQRTKKKRCARPVLIPPIPLAWRVSSPNGEDAGNEPSIPITRIVHHTARRWPSTRRIESNSPPPKKRARNRSACGRPRAGCICRSLGKETVHSLEGQVLLLFCSSVDSPSVRAADAARQELELVCGLPCLSLAGVVSVLCSVHSRMFDFWPQTDANATCTTSGQCGGLMIQNSRWEGTRDNRMGIAMHCRQSDILPRARGDGGHATAANSNSHQAQNGKVRDSVI